MSVSDKTHYRKSFDEKETLGQGGYGIVVQATHKLDGRNYAVKKVPFTGASSKKDKYLREVRALATLEHQNIVRYYTTWTQDVFDPKDFTREGIGDEESTASSSGSLFESSSIEDTVSMIIFIQMELCSSNLKQWLDDRNQQMSSPSAENIKIVMAMMREILSGLAFMHSKNFVHRDLKPTNILLQDNHIKIGDFGLVKEISDDDESSMAGNSSSGDTRMLYAVGTFPYAAPELSAGTLNPTTKSDIYSLGVTFLEMCMCVTTRHELHVNLTKLKEDQLLPPKTWYKQAQIIKTMVSGLPERRPSAEDLLSSPLFTSDQISNVNVMAQSTALRYQPPYQADFFLTLPLVKVVRDQGAVKLPYTPSSSSIDSDASMKNPVSGLYQLAERLSLKPEYNYRSSATSSNMLVFECTVTVGEHSFTSPPNCRRKQDAKVAAAKIAFVQLKKLFLEKRRISNQQASAVSLAPRDESLHSLYRRFRFPGINPLYSRPPLVASCAVFMEKNRQANVASLAPHDESSDREQDGKRLSDSFENMSLNESQGCSFSRDSSFDGAANVGPTGEKDPVSAFMEYGQSKRLSADIVVLRQSGPPNRPVFEMAATLGERQFPAITCHNKKQGRKLAAKAALEIVEKENRVQA